MSERLNIPGTSLYESVIGFSRAVRIGRHVMVSGTGPIGSEECSVAEQTDRQRLAQEKRYTAEGEIAG